MRATQSPKGMSPPLAVDERGRLLLSPQQHLTRAQFPARLLDWAADNLLLTILLVGTSGAVVAA